MTRVYFVRHAQSDCRSGSVVLGWTPIEALQALTIYPRFLKEEIHCLDGPIKHFISTD